MKYLSGLPNLLSLWSYQAYQGDRLKFEEGGFQKLMLLELSDFYQLKVVKIERGALPLLEELQIGLSPQLKEVPSGMIYFKNFKLVEISEMPMDFVLGLQPQGCQHSWKVWQVESIHSWYRGEGDVYDVFHGQ